MAAAEYQTERLDHLEIVAGGGVTLVNEPEFGLWLEWEHFESWDSDDPEDDFFNMHVRLPGGRYYALNVWTYRMLERAHQKDLKTGDHLEEPTSIRPTCS